MIGIVVATHGDLADGFASALKLLAGDQKGVATVGLYPGEEPSSFKDKLERAIDSVDDSDGVLVMVDLFGGTPSNTSCQFITRDDIRIVAGVNLPMVIEACFMRDSFEIDELVKHTLNAAADSLIDAREKIVEAVDLDDDEDF